MSELQEVARRLVSEYHRSLDSRFPDLTPEQKANVLTAYAAGVLAGLHVRIEVKDD
jgi:hypothetical protein